MERGKNGSELVVAIDVGEKNMGYCVALCPTGGGAVRVIGLGTVGSGKSAAIKRAVGTKKQLKQTPGTKTKTTGTNARTAGGAYRVARMAYDAVHGHLAQGATAGISKVLIEKQNIKNRRACMVEAAVWTLFRALDGASVVTVDPRKVARDMKLPVRDYRAKKAATVAFVDSALGITKSKSKSKSTTSAILEHYIASKKRDDMADAALLIFHHIMF